MRLVWLVTISVMVGAAAPEDESRYLPDYYAGEFAPALRRSAPAVQQHLTDEPQRISGDRAGITETNQRGTEQSPLVVKLVEPKQAERKTDEGSSYKPSHANQWVKWIRLAIDSLSTSDWVAVGAVLVAALQFGALVCTIRVMRHSAERQLRAYLSIEPGKIKTFDIGSVIEIEMIIRNHGQTPAYKAHHHGAVEILANPLPAFFEIDAPTGDTSSATTVHPDQETRAACRGRVELTKENVLALTTTDEIRVNLFGMVAYEDVFGRNRLTQSLISIPSADIRAIATHKTVEMGIRWVYNYKHTKAT